MRTCSKGEKRPLQPAVKESLWGLCVLDEEHAASIHYRTVR